MIGAIGCASGTVADLPDADPADASTADAPIDAPAVCEATITQVLVNPVFDLAPVGMGWTEQRISGSPLVRADGPVPEDTAPNMAWLGGFAGNVTDALFQDVAIPALTTKLVLTGQHRVITQETSPNVFDTASLALAKPDGTPIETALMLSNRTTTGAWLEINHAFTPDLSGQTVRLRATSTNDQNLVTSFFFDTLALTATHGCP